MSLLLALTGTPSETTEKPSGGWFGYLSWFEPRRTRRREEDSEPEQEREVVTPTVDTRIAERVAKLQAQIIRARNAQDRAQKQANAAIAERDAMLSKALMAQALAVQRAAEDDYLAAVRAEALARQQLMDLDIAFVAAVLMDS